MYNWIRDFLFNRTIQVRVSTAFSQIHTIENGTPQGSVSSPILFNIMINDIFTKVDRGIGRSLYADDGALWKRGRNVKYVEKLEMGLMPQVIRRLKLKMRYFISIKGHSDSHPVKMVLEDCWEYGHKKLSSFGWKASEEARKIGLSDFNVAPTVARSAIPPWLFPMPLIDIQLLENVDPEFGKTAVAVYIPLFNIRMSKRTSDHISVFTAEIIAICLALQWIEEIQPTRAVICTDSLSALNSLESGTSSARQDMINQVMQSLYRTRQYGILVNFVWVPSHMGVKGNEEADNLAKQALNHSQIDVEVALRSEVLENG
uniref:Uncharacterized protein n=1 Tax=Cyprinus carpio carpio TaxID=630221 RepID=A0A9J8CA31_CYPCA